MAQQDRMTVWLKNAVLFSALAFFCLLCVLSGILLSMVMDVRRQVDRLQKESDRVKTGLERVEEQAAQALDNALLAGMVSKGLDQLPVQSVGPGGNTTAQREVAHLLDCIGRPELRYEYEGKARTAPWVQMKLRGKALLQAKAITSAEDFIGKVAAKTNEGAAYHVVDKDGNKRELQDWLKERLREFRTSEAALSSQP